MISVFFLAQGLLVQLRTEILNEMDIYLKIVLVGNFQKIWHDERLGWIFECLIDCLSAILRQNLSHIYATWFAMAVFFTWTTKEAGESH